MTGDRSALVVGASGFVGRHVVATLREQGWSVVALRRPTSSTPSDDPDSGVQSAILHQPSDLPAILDASHFDTIFHLAAHQSRGHAHADIESFVDANLRLGMHLFGAASDRGIQVVHALSYTQFRQSVPAVHSLYSATKQAQAEFARYWRDATGADIRGVVLFDNFGPDDTRAKLIPGLIRAVRRGEPMSIGPLEQPVDLLHVRDVANGLIAAALGEPVAAVAVRADDFVTVGSIVDLVGEAAGLPVPIQVDPLRVVSDHPVQAGTWARPNGWRPEVNLADGIAECVAVAP